MAIYFSAINRTLGLLLVEKKKAKYYRHAIALLQQKMEKRGTKKFGFLTQRVNKPKNSMLIHELEKMLSIIHTWRVSE